MSVRKARLVDCNPEWVIFYGKQNASPDAVYLDCPEGHEGCRRVIPFTPALDGTPRPHALWQRTGDTFETLTLTPSIRGIPRYADKEAALKAGCLERYVTPSMFCALHIFISNGAIDFCGDSR